MPTATITSHDTRQHITNRSTTQPTNTPTTQLERSAAQRLRTTTAAVKLSFTWLGVRKNLAPEQRTTAARAFHADRELLSASKLILDTKNPAYRAVDAGGDVRCVYGEELDLRELGKLRITRASHVEPNRDGFWWADMGPVDGPVLGPLRNRSEAAV